MSTLQAVRNVAPPVLVHPTSVDIEIALSFANLFAPGAYDMHALAAENAVATWLHDRGDLQDAERVYRRVARMLRHRNYGGGTKQRAAVMFNLGVVLEGQGRFDEAESCLRDSIALSQKMLHPDQGMVFHATRRLSTVLQSQGKWEDAAHILRRFIVELKHGLGEHHPITLQISHTLADILQHMGKLSEARALYEETLQLKQRALGMQHPSTLTTRESLALLLGDMQQHADAVEQLRIVVATRRDLHGDTDLATLRAQNNLGHFLQCAGDLHEAEQQLRSVARVQHELLGCTHDDTLRTMTNLATVLGKSGTLDEAEHLFRAILSARHTSEGDAHCETIVARNNLAAFLVEHHQMIRTGEAIEHALQEAATLLEEGMHHARDLPEHNRVYLAHLESWYGRCLLLLNRAEHAELYAIRGYVGFGEALGYDHERTHKALVVLTDVYRSSRLASSDSPHSR